MPLTSATATSMRLERHTTVSLISSTVIRLEINLMYMKDNESGCANW
jgi:hypothetical protein